MMGRWEREDKDEDEKEILKIYIWEDERKRRDGKRWWED